MVIILLIIDLIILLSELFMEDTSISDDLGYTEIFNEIINLLHFVYIFFFLHPDIVYLLFPDDSFELVWLVLCEIYYYVYIFFKYTFVTLCISIAIMFIYSISFIYHLMYLFYIRIWTLFELKIINEFLFGFVYDIIYTILNYHILYYLYILFLILLYFIFIVKFWIYCEKKELGILNFILLFPIISLFFFVVFQYFSICYHIIFIYPPSWW